MSLFTVTQSRVVPSTFIVEGTDITGKSGSTKLTSPAWAQVLAKRVHLQAADVFGEAVDKMFAPITEAASAAHRIMHPTTEQWSTYVFEKGAEHEPRIELELDEHGTYLYMLETTDGTMFRWIGDELFV